MSENNNNHEIVVSFIPPKKWFQRAKWRVHEDFTSLNGNVKVPKGFVSDGATIPWWARSLFSPTGRYFGAAIIHDYLIEVMNDFPRANVEFEQEMINIGVSAWIRYTLMGVVQSWWFIKAKIHEARKNN